jgi:hypothetical protein
MAPTNSSEVVRVHCSNFEGTCPNGRPSIELPADLFETWSLNRMFPRIRQNIIENGEFQVPEHWIVRDHNLWCSVQCWAEFCSD